MSDDADRAALVADAIVARGLASISADIPAGRPGECDECGETMPRLVGGRCGFCRDGRRPPLSRFDDQSTTTQEAPTMAKQPTGKAASASAKPLPAVIDLSTVPLAWITEEITRRLGIAPSSEDLAAAIARAEAAETAGAAAVIERDSAVAELAGVRTKLATVSEQLEGISVLLNVVRRNG